MSGLSPQPNEQRGIALVTALVLVAIATVLAATIGFGAAMASRRASAVFGADQALLAAEGAEAMAAYAIKVSANPPSGSVSTDQAWAQPYGPYELAPGVTLEFAQIEDEQGKFNINNLAPGGADDPVEIAQFQHLLSSLGLEPKWAGILADWIDVDDTPNDPDGAEDSVYLGQTPPYHAANMPVTSISELLALPGFGRERYDRLAPYITALPPHTTINICTASGLLLDALSGKTEYSVDPTSLTNSRQEGGCFPSQSAFNQSFSATQLSQIQDRVGISSSYFRLRTTITVGTARFNLYSLLYVDPSSGQIRPIIRTFGTE